MNGLGLSGLYQNVIQDLVLDHRRWISDWKKLFFNTDLLNISVNIHVLAMGSIRRFIINEQLLLLVRQLWQLHSICWKYFFNFPLFTGTDPRKKQSENSQNLYHIAPQKQGHFGITYSSFIPVLFLQMILYLIGMVDFDVFIQNGNFEIENCEIKTPIKFKSQYYSFCDEQKNWISS